MSLWHALTCAIERHRIASAIADGRYHQAAARIEAYVEDALARIGVPDAQ